MITNIQLLRAFAAMSVVFYHTAFLLPGNIYTEFQGVSIFFVISGFIISQIASDNPIEFFYHRLVRIVPIYWIATAGGCVWWLPLGGRKQIPIVAGIVLIGLAGKFLSKARNRFNITNEQRRLLLRGVMALLILASILAPVYVWVRPSHLKPLFVLKSLLFIPALDANGDLHPVLGVGWTLDMEMFFYVVFAVALFAGKQIAPILASLVLIIIKVLYVTGICTNNYFEFYSHPYVMFFIVGAMLNYAFIRLKDRVIPKKLAIILLLVAVAYLLFYNLAPRDWFPFLKGAIAGYVCMYAGPTILVGAALLCHSARIRCNWSTAILLGNASYSLYLFHPIIIEALRPAIPMWRVLDFSHNIFGLLAVFVIATLVSIVSYVYLERPFQKELRDFGKAVERFFRQSSPGPLGFRTIFTGERPQKKAETLDPVESGNAPRLTVLFQGYSVFPYGIVEICTLPFEIRFLLMIPFTIALRRPYN